MLFVISMWIGDVEFFLTYNEVCDPTLLLLIEQKIYVYNKEHTYD